MAIKSVFFLILLVLPAHAGIYLHEPFAYAVGDDALTAAPPWSDVRYPEAVADVVAGSLEYTDAGGRVLRTSGARVLVDTAAEETEVRHRRPLNLSAHQGPELWISVLGQQTAGDARRFFNLAFMTPDDVVEPADRNTEDDEAFSIGIPSGSTPFAWSFYNRSANNGRRLAMSSVPTTRASLLVARVERNADGGRAERYTFWVNPPLGVAPPEADGLSFTSVDGAGEPASDFNEWTDLIAMRIGAGTQNGEIPAASWLVDEIRVGSAWADVLPWSPPLEWLGLPPAPGASGAALTWRPAPGRTDVVEWSSDLRVWTPYEASRHLGLDGETEAGFTAPAPPAGAASHFLRVRREP